MASNGKDWVDILSAFSTPLIAAIAVWVAYRQWQTDEKSRKKNHLKYYADNYELVANAVGIVVRTARVSDEVIGYLLTARSNAVLYLSQEIIDFTDSLANTAIDISVLQEELTTIESGFERTNKIRQKGELIKKLGGARPHLIYRRYLLCE